MRNLMIGWLGGLVVWAFIAGCSTTLPKADKPFPNPYYVVSGGTAEVTFTDLSACCTIEISTSTGNLLRTIFETDGDGQATWDLKNDSGENLTGGLYLYIIKSSEGDRKGKIIITK